MLVLLIVMAAVMHVMLIMVIMAASLAATSNQLSLCLSLALCAAQGAQWPDKCPLA